MADKPSQPDPRTYRLTTVVYLLYLLGLLVGFTPILGAAILYMRRERVAGTIYASHFDWLIRTFWWMLGICAVAGAVFLVGVRNEVPPMVLVGGIGLLIAMIWFLYRILKGYMWLVSAEAVRGRRERARTTAGRS